MYAYLIYLLLVQYYSYNLNILHKYINLSDGISEVNIDSGCRAITMDALEKKRLLDILENENVSVHTKLALIEKQSAGRVTVYDLTHGNLLKDWEWE